ncbi:hypothetical protein FRZ44_37950 [Hypericibacter terrae]|uniref:Uncharacterized protein n=1 Tax=Hypericibacter terrae TaxID=2602015 RepID=A0A5J6MLQ2_9PROT|nr:hypothetical protein [Hypericibacter terrae]QEX18488.1 hypothetical protein FRZ44_37950 [Hypericibacter terrae]
MAISEAFAGSATISGTETSLTTNTAGPDVETSDGVFQTFIDLNAMATGDEFQIKAYEKVQSSDTQRVVYQSNPVGPQSPPIFVMPSLVLINGWDITLKKIAGTDRTITWSIRKVG